VYDDLVKYLLMVRKKVKDPKVDTELVYAYAQGKDLGPLEEFIVSTHLGNLQSVGDRCASPSVCGEFGCLHPLYWLCRGLCAGPLLLLATCCIQMLHCQFAWLMLQLPSGRAE
jgi:hypothetical protein